MTGTGIAGYEGRRLASWVRVRYTGLDVTVACSDFAFSAAKPREVGRVLATRTGRTHQGTYGAQVRRSAACPVAHRGGRPVA